MCIAILLPPFKELDKETLLRCNTANPDGFGYAAFIRGSLYMRKYVDEKKILKQIDKFISFRQKNLEQTFLVHFRIATHGKISTRCTHPFKVNQNVVFCHNGILRQDFGVDIRSLESDTMMFNRNILQRLEKSCLDSMIKGKNKVLFDLLEGYIGSGNKMILLHKDGDFKILNESAGVWDKGVWYSNDSYKERKVITWSNYGNYYGSSWRGEYWDNKSGCWKSYESANWWNGKKK